MDEAKKNIETLASEAILQKDVEIKVGNRTFKAAPPSTATLILVSEAVSRLPHIKLEETRLVEESIAVAKDCREIGDVAAILLLGARHLTETVTEAHTVRKPRLWGLYHTTEVITVTRTIDRKAELSKELLETLTPSELNYLIVELLKKMQLTDFFGLTTFLTEINLLRQTKVET